MAKVKIEPNIIVIPEGRASFLNHVTPSYRTDKFGREIKVRPDGSKVKPQFRMTWLLDPSNTVAAGVIAAVKAEAARILDLFFEGRANWPKDNATTGTKGILTCFGNGNDLKKVYDGYKDMFYIKCADTTPPIIGDRRGRQVQMLEDNAWHVLDRATGKATEEVVDANEVPFGGAYCRGRITLYPYNNEQAGVNANFRSIQYLRFGESFGGGGRRSAAEELEQMAGDAPGAKAAAFDADLPF